MVTRRSRWQMGFEVVARSEQGSFIGMVVGVCALHTVHGLPLEDLQQLKKVWKLSSNPQSCQIYALNSATRRCLGRKLQTLSRKVVIEKCKGEVELFVKEKLSKEEELAWENRMRETELIVDFECRVKEHFSANKTDSYCVCEFGFWKVDNDYLLQDLHEMLMKLRDDFWYCLFCGCQYESMEALLANCPGINGDDH
ncbi:G patch domain-containing protein 11 [Tanacetum coccineum]|uniref:G patch domain-containing protein 11 n=1 Tax=Tanacetum coccineum TaxID=301880 RepID=A0ABQ5B506_9ASTR